MLDDAFATIAEKLAAQRMWPLTDVCKEVAERVRN